MRILAMIVASVLCGFASGAATAQETRCDDPFDEIMTKARAQWPYSRPHTIREELVNYFVVGYNIQPDRGRDVSADTIVVFAFENDVATWYYLGFENGCMTFWVDLTPIKGQELIEIGHAIADRQHVSAP